MDLYMLARIVYDKLFVLPEKSPRLKPGALDSTHLFLCAMTQPFFLEKSFM